MSEQKTADTKPLDFLSEIMAVDLSTVEMVYSPLQEDEHVIGTMSDNLRRLAHCRWKLVDEYNTLVERYTPLLKRYREGEDEVRSELNILLDKLEPLSPRMKGYDKIFWTVIALDFPETIDKIIVIRDGDQIAWKERPIQENKQPPLEVLGILVDFVPADSEEEEQKTH